jgi:hypothetical protein
VCVCLGGGGLRTRLSLTLSLSLSRMTQCRGLIEVPTTLRGGSAPEWGGDVSERQEGVNEALQTTNTHSTQADNETPLVIAIDGPAASGKV